MDIKTKYSIGDVIKFQEQGNICYDEIEKIVIKKDFVRYTTKNYGYDIMTRKEHLITEDKIICSYQEKIN